jgi:hypothetical protein
VDLWLTTYSVLARAVLNLETADDPAARKELYKRARRFIVAELRKQNPQISAQAIRREQAALEAAVRRIEAEIPQTTANEKTGRQGSPDRSASPAVFNRYVVTFNESSFTRALSEYRSPTAARV